MNDDTVEGACILMNKIGYIIDDKREKEESKGKETANLKRLQEYDAVYKRFEDLANDEKLSQRIKILIKNMLDNRKNNWEKSRKESEKDQRKLRRSERSMKKRLRLKRNGKLARE